MKDDEDLYDKNLRMRFILRIAKEFHQVMKKYEKNMSGYLSHIANNNIVDGAGIYD
ncbi:hypothetical protein [Acinetobacter sp. MB5]|uniref:hypothetical protein n=1 Tax=Acinetobacter sp. MB5 TaxID=2069438 RepID=UPI0013A6890C|nr:hypothetical protein [Acinetobacter sp. MB5]